MPDTSSTEESTIVTQRLLQTGLAAGLLVSLSQPAAAQGRAWEDRVFAGVTFGLQTSSSDIADNTTLQIYGEQGSLVSNASFDADSLVDISVGARVWGNVGVAVGYHTISTTGAGDIQGSVPHPIFFDRPRTFTVPIDGIDRDEHAAHLMIGWMAPLTDTLDVFVYAGPSFFRLTQEVIGGITLAEQGPPFTTVVVQPAIETRKRNSTGFNVGADVTYHFYEGDRVRFGVGGFVRFTRAKTEIRLANTETSTDVGGPQVGVGARVRF